MKKKTLDEGTKNMLELITFRKDIENGCPFYTGNCQTELWNSTYNECKFYREMMIKVWGDKTLKDSTN